jgi:hypothetical protein
MNHIDIINEQLNYRISLSSEKELSASLKDIFQQINSRQDKVLPSFIPDRVDSHKGNTAV